MKKITDQVLGRSVSLALVSKPVNAVFGADADWSRPVYYEVKNSDDIFVRMPHGQYAVRVMSLHAVDLLIHVDGQLRKRVTVPKGISYVECDGDGRTFYFLKEGEVAGNKPRTDQEAMAALTGDTASGATASGDIASSESDQSADLFGADENVSAAVQEPFVVPAGHGLVFIVARFSEELTPGLKPPAQEYEATFKMASPEDHDEGLASSGLLHMVPPDSLINLDDELSFEPSQKHRPSFVCTCTGCRHGGSMRNY